MKSIRIFSTQRIDLNSFLIDNEQITPIRCGAVYDDRKTKIIGDDTGDNISEKRNSYCELTTQYWAWKNIDADYYGFMHYRRYFNFNEETLASDDWNTVVLDELCPSHSCIFFRLISCDTK